MMRAFASLVLVLGSGWIALLPAETTEPILLTVDASRIAGQSVLSARERLAVKSGALTLYYPQWIPGEHMPSGPISNLTGLRVKANGVLLPWRREPHNLYAFDLTVPQDADHLDIDMTFLGATYGHYSSSRLASSSIGVIIWNQALLYPAPGSIQSLVFRPSLVLPGREWQFATALTGERRKENTVTWDETTLEHLVDSPVDIGTNFKRWELWHDGDAAVYLNVFADTKEETNASDGQIAHLRRLVDEMLAMYGARHWRNYNFLLTLSNVLPGEGVEHHESSDDGAKGDFFGNPARFEEEGGLLPHEFNHSWNGKYRRPAGLYLLNFNQPYDDSLLWVYEGMTQYYGNVMAWRAGVRSAATYPDHVAADYAFFDHEPGREWRSLHDTAVSAPYLYNAPPEYGAERRGVDFYDEGELLWLKVDSIIREKTGNRDSLDTFARAFFGQRNTGPIVKTYTRQDIIEGLNRIAPYNWAEFFVRWVDQVAPHPPDGFTADGWKLVYTPQPQHFVTKSDCWYSIGVSTRGGEVVDVRSGSPAWIAGLGINTKIVAVAGRGYSSQTLYDAIREAQTSNGPVKLTVRHQKVVREVSIDYHGGPKYPHLVRIPGTADRLSEIVKPRSGA
jgi:predicted metalloprotease with PDZ domain